MSRKKKVNVYHELVGCMSLFDLVGSTAWVLSTLPIPKSFTNGRQSSSYEVYGAHGNQATCRFQGFLLQLGLTGTFYYASLTMYYWLTIKHGVREYRMKENYRWYLLVPPFVVGLVLALLGLPYYRPIFFVCHVPPIDLSGDQTNVHFFTTIPIVFAILCSVGSMIPTYLHVRRTDRRASRWRMGTPNTGSIQNASYLDLSDRVRAPSPTDNNANTSNPTFSVYNNNPGDGHVGSTSSLAIGSRSAAQPQSQLAVPGGKPLHCQQPRKSSINECRVLAICVVRCLVSVHVSDVLYVNDQCQRPICPVLDCLSPADPFARSLERHSLFSTKVSQAVIAE